MDPTRKKKRTQTASTLTLRVPIANEEERALFQRRLALTGFIVFALSFGFFVVTLVSVAIVAPSHVPHLFTEHSSQIHLATSLASLVVWLSIRRGKPSVNRLSAADMGLAIGICLGWSAMAIAGIPLPQRPEMIALLASSFTLVVRASLIPSTPARTAVLGFMSFAPLVFMTHGLYANNVNPPSIQQWGLPPAIDVSIWGALGCAATTVISYVIYGLRQQVRKAMQLGQYMLEDKIGEGGMGVVYRASHAMLRRPTAIKLLSEAVGPAAARFEREVQITARLTHPNTIAVFDYGRTPDGVFYYAMEYLEGISLEELVIEHGAQPSRRVAHILLQMCGALHEAHKAGLVHRDIKPANVMLTERGGVPDVVKVLDFGLVMESKDESTEKADGEGEKATIMGTPHYMAPEAIRDPAGIDARADLYAVGATAYFLLTGEHVFDGNSLVEICSQHLHDAPASIIKKKPDVPANLERVVLALLAKKPDDRPKDAATLASMIRECAVGEWTVDEAVQWWVDRPRTRNSAAVPANGVKVKPRSTEVSQFGKTIAVALDDRDRAAS
jgi:serine/threonine protein kinase